MEKRSEPNKWLHLSTSTQFDTGVGGGGDSLHCEDAMVTKDKLQLTHLSIVIQALVEHLSKMLQENPKQQQKTYRALCAKLKEYSLVDSSYLLEELASLRSHYFSAILTIQQSPSIRGPILETSRYATEYEEIELIESGGFGDVYRARNKLDQQEYAIKRIKVKYKAPFLRTLAEVKTLARLNHSNIVQYKSAWLELAALPPEPPSLTEQPETSDYSEDIVFDHGSSEETTETCTDDASNQAVCRFRTPQQPIPQPGAQLYVCMELCNETLRNWLDRRNEAGEAVDVRLALNIIQQVASAIAHIHAAHITHHDIKPGNLFITSNMRVLLGDFGLSCTPDMDTCPVVRGQRGTRLYAAPEQLESQCRQKSDVFSLGLVLLELLLPFPTAMERVCVLNKARNSQLPDVLSPHFHDFLSSLTATEQDRPSARDVLNQLTILQDQIHTIANETNETTDDDKDLIINRLRRLLAEKDDTIKQLHESLNLLRSNSEP